MFRLILALSCIRQEIYCYYYPHEVPHISAILCFFNYIYTSMIFIFQLRYIDCEVHCSFVMFSKTVCLLIDCQQEVVCYLKSFVPMVTIKQFLSPCLIYKVNSYSS